MIIENNQPVALLDELTQKAKINPRLRQTFDLRNSENDQSQRVLNALEPGTEVPIHRHRKSTETVAVLRGKVRQSFYDDNGKLQKSIIISAGDSCPFYVVNINQWHKTESLESGTIIFESKDGVYEPISQEDILIK